MKLIKNLNRTQKKILLTELGVIVLTLIIWFAFGGEIFTKTEVLVKTTDPILGNTYSEWRSQFVWGLDLSLIISGVTFVVSLIATFFLRSKNSNH